MPKPLREGSDRLMDASARPLRCRELPQDSIDHASRVRLASCTAKLHTLAKCSVSRNTIEMQELEGPESQCDGNRLREPLFRPLQQRADAGIEGDLPAEHAHYQRSSEVAVLRRERIDPSRVEELVAMPLVLTDQRENLEGSEACRSDLRKSHLRRGCRSGGSRPLPRRRRFSSWSQRS
jgi:hypothetical protein